MTAKWTDGLSFITSPQSVTHSVQGTDMQFLPISAITLLKLKGLVEPIAQCLAVLFDDHKNDAGSVYRKFKGEDGEDGEETIAEAAKPEVIQLRITKREKAVTTLMAALTDHNNILALATVVLDSLRNHSWGGGVTKAPPPLELVEQTSIASLVDMLTGVAKANQGVFGPLGLKLGGLGTKINEFVQVKIANAESEQPRSPSGQMAEAAGTTKAGTIS